jgi:transcriptional regulator with XRE-family HTH domain
MVSQRRPAEFVKGVGHRLKKVRLALGFNQKEFISKLDVKKSAYSQWESGIQLIDPFKALILSQKFGITMDYIYGGIETALPEDIRKKL